MQKEKTFHTPIRIAITNRHLCYDFFLQHGLATEGTNPCDCLLQLIEKIAKSDMFDIIILREKDMDESDYKRLAASALSICNRYGKELIVHNFPAVAKACGCRVHLPFPVFCNLAETKHTLASGTSIHSIEDAVFAQKHGASYIIAGHIFATDCKKGLPGRGLAWLTSVCHAVTIPVYAIGGITDTNMPDVLSCGAAGVCMMSGVLDLLLHLV